jgi:hypothetical protein
MVIGGLQDDGIAWVCPLVWSYFGRMIKLRVLAVDSRPGGQAISGPVELVWPLVFMSSLDVFTSYREDFVIRGGLAPSVSGWTLDYDRSGVFGISSPKFVLTVAKAVKRRKNTPKPGDVAFDPAPAPVAPCRC